jgi:hypothetical protein
MRSLAFLPLIWSAIWMRSRIDRANRSCMVTGGEVAGC